MADTAISGLTDGAPAVGTDVTVVARGAANRKLALSAVRTYMLATLHPVAISGSYNDLGGTPTIPATTSDLPEGSNLYYTNARVDARVSALLPGGSLVSTMSEGNTGAQNITAFAADLAAAYAAGQSYFIPDGDYDFGHSDGTQVTIDLAVIRAVAIRGASGGRTKLKIPSGNSAIPLILTALTTAIAYTPTAMATVTSGTLDNFTSLSTRSETTKFTFSGLPALAAPGRMISVVSNDLLPYAVSAYERNFQHEISTILDVYDTSDEVYLCEKLLRTYTTANYCRAYIYDNDDIIVDIDDITFTADGDIYDTAITARPTFVFSILGVRNPRIGPGVRFESVWAGTVRFGACLSPSYEASAKNLLNNLNGLTVLGYDPAFDGANRCPRVTFRNGENARHSPTSTWLEENQLILNNTGFTAGASTVFGYTSSGNDNPAVNDLLYIDVSGVTGTINTMPVGWYTVTARSGTAGSGSVTVSYDSTGDTFSSGTGTAEMFEPDQWYRYGEMMQARFEGLDSLFSYGAPFDEHENAYGTEWNDIRCIAPIEYTAGAIVPKGLSIRGACTRVNRFSQYRGTAGIAINSTTQNHGVENTIVLNDLEFRNQQDMAAAQPYIAINGSASVTDKRKTIVNGLNVDGGAYRVIEHQADSGNLEVNNFNFNGDWGISPTASAYILTHEGGVAVYNGGVIDLTSVVTNDEVRIAQLTGGTLHFRGTHFKGMSGESNYPFRIETNSGCVLIFEDCTFEWDSTATDDTLRLVLVSDVTCAIHFRGTTKLINSAKLDDARGLVVVDEAGGGGTGHADIYIGEIQADGAYNIVGTATDGTYTLRDRNRKQRVHTAAGAATLAAEDDTLIINKTSGAATAVNITPGALVIGKRYTVKDGKLDSATNNITLTATAGSIISDASASTYVMNSNGQSVDLETDGTNIYVL